MPGDEERLSDTVRTENSAKWRNIEISSLPGWLDAAGAAHMSHVSVSRPVRHRHVDAVLL